MLQFQLQNPNFEARVRESFDRQQVMHTIGATLTRIEPGIVEIELPHRTELTQQHGFIHAGIVATILDSACGYAAFSLMPEGASVLSVEFKVNLLAPAKGELLVARGEVKRAGKTITVCAADAIMNDAEKTKIVATMLATIMCLRDRSDLAS